MSVYDPGSAFKIGWKFGANAGDHVGVDFKAPVGTRIPAAAAGTVVGRGYEDTYGNTLIIRHSGPTEPPYRYTLYAHMKEPSPLSLGDHVWRGRPVGEVDSTGNGGGEEPHLHFELVHLTEDDGSWESNWGRWFAKPEAQWDGSFALMIGGRVGRIDPLLDMNWDGVDVYQPPTSFWQRRH
ncbi:MAG: M23 family metallopeptidase [Myxococcales bacterium]|nr:M23 family metallopeptidase [Myxococcales bacterium]